MREIALDTETTGLNPKAGHRVVEIGCVEMINHVATGEVFHVYINPERDMPEEAFAVHGLSAEFLKTHPVFKDVAADFLAFIGDDPLVIHNAAFDMGFLNAELEQAGHAALPMDRAVDTVQMARRKFPGAQANLDALCRRFGVDNTARELHGALLDARLLADVYLELRGGRQTGFGLDDQSDDQVDTTAAAPIETVTRPKREPRVFRPNDDELARHAAFVEGLSDPIWNE